ncbi:uncharacterized protein EV422DRAFT_535730 [Fimicolochytrium jonesii]|uniref:uncharacterized protein n=1 Tax=Fimicolochytrium jonesii TaxID=1396493 RepID=UPI0022FE7A7D|nr:uncharacterized protein EV422DRAFT_535730 [Fimicolochytrium jonesii]KAI8819260.1 hypothetical protein EV422DRAFT_535730 [Fimicolochytrium jonesii]
MQKAKVRGANMMMRRRPRVLEHDKIRTWKIFEGDQVKIATGKYADVGKTGTVTQVLKDINSVIIEELNQKKKHMRPNAEQPKGSVVFKSTPVKYSHLQLVDPQDGTAIPLRDLKLITPLPARLHNNPTTKQLSKQRLHIQRPTEEGAEPIKRLISIPEPNDRFANRPKGVLDTPRTVVETVTFTPVLGVSPFPNAFLNELERMRRKNRESMAC